MCTCLVTFIYIQKHTHIHTAHTFTLKTYNVCVCARSKIHKHTTMHTHLYTMTLCIHTNIKIYIRTLYECNRQQKSNLLATPFIFVLNLRLTKIYLLNKKSIHTSLYLKGGMAAKQESIPLILKEA